MYIKALWQSPLMAEAHEVTEGSPLVTRDPQAKLVSIV